MFSRSMEREIEDDVEIEIHLQEALARAQNEETKYLLREALQKYYCEI